MVEFKVARKEDIVKIQKIAEQTWWAAYSSILSSEQIQYMLDTLYSEEALLAIIKDHEQELIILYENNLENGFACYGKRPENEFIYKLHKLYVLPSHQKRGFGRLILNEIITRLHSINIHTLELNVNRNNPAKLFYKKLGFQIMTEEDIPIGPFWMNDYVMRLEF